jgi:hypothetical protein
LTTPIENVLSSPSFFSSDYPRSGEEFYLKESMREREREIKVIKVPKIF